MVITLLVIFNIEMADKQARQLELDRDTTALAGELERKATENIAYLNAAASMLSVTRNVQENEFAQFVTDMSTNHLSRGALGMGWAQWARPGDIAAIEAGIAARGIGTAVKVRPVPADPKTNMAVIAFLEPQTADNRRVLGFDMASEAVRRDAIERAIETGRAAVSGKVQLMQDEQRSPSAGILIFVPVFERAPDGRIQRSALKGLAYTPLRVQQFLEAISPGFDRAGAGVALYDGPALPQNRMASTGPVNSDHSVMERRVAFGDRTWTLTVTASQAPGLTLASMVALVAGVAVSLLLLALTMVIITRAADDRRVLESLAAQEAIRTSLTRELNHRVKNTLANVLSIVALTRRRSSNLEEFADSLSGRLRALSATHDLLSQRNWTDAPVGEVVRAELAPYLEPEDHQTDISGPEIALGPNDALSLGLALHELATNAAKYGALSVPGGHVSVTWSRMEEGLCKVEWKESGGPPVQTPGRRGFGMDLIQKIVSHELRAPVELTFDPGGVRCVLTVPIRTLGNFALRDGAAG
ncbi:CHASE domain-containing protein [Novosphingobium aquiterrae]|uniref:histidine kinase n=1 Tax=Novosphingobium aquiterrae TaxID=624388 RepID=A0ABV6PFL2_9SPHN